MKKILFICASVALIAALGSCKKECVCKKVQTTTQTVADTTLSDTLAAKSTVVSVDSVMYTAGHIYDKRECEYLNLTDSTSERTVAITCSMEEIDKNK